MGHAVASTVSGASGAAAVVAAASVGADRRRLRAQPRASLPGTKLLDQSTSHPAAPTVTTERHDTLWLLAEQYLGAGERYVEIVELNHGVGQPDGRSLGDDGRIYPGWTLTLPADAAVDAARPERHGVERGDTLWEIAGDELGDPTRYPEIVEANQGDLQPDGRRLVDPDLILHGLGPGDPRGRGLAGPLRAGWAGGRTKQPRPDPPPMSPIDRAPSAPESPTDAPDAAAPSAAPGDAAAGLPTLDRATVAPAISGEDGPGEGLAPDSESEPAVEPPAHLPGPDRRRPAQRRGRRRRPPHRQRTPSRSARQRQQKKAPRSRCRPAGQPPPSSWPGWVLS